MSYKGVLRAIGSKAFGRSKSVEAASVGTLREARARAQAKMAGDKKEDERKADVSTRKFEYEEGMDDSPITADGSAAAPKTPDLARHRDRQRAHRDLGCRCKPSSSCSTMNCN